MTPTERQQLAKGLFELYLCVDAEDPDAIAMIDVRCGDARLRENHKAIVVAVEWIRENFPEAKQ